jgi:cytochrome c551/c552
LKDRFLDLVVATLLASSLCARAQAQGTSGGGEPPRVDATLAKKGKKLFQSKLCSSCHSIGKGKVVGPDLKGVTERRPREWLMTMIMTPEIALAQDTIAQRMRSEHGNIAMPNMRVNPEEFEQLLHFLASRAKH